MSPHPTAAAAPPSTMATGAQPQNGSHQQQAHHSASESAAGAHQLEAQWEAETMNAAQKASRLSLLQAEHTQVELELAEAAQQAEAASMTHDWNQEAAVASAAAPEHAAPLHPWETLSAALEEQQEQPAISGSRSESQCEAPAAQATQSEPVRLIPRCDSRRLTRSSARARCASQSSGSDAVSSAHEGRRGKRQTQAVTTLPAVAEQSEADSAVDTAASSAKHDSTSQAAADSEADKEADPSTADAELTSMPEEEALTAAPAGLTAPEAGQQQTIASHHGCLPESEAHLATAPDAPAAVTSAACQEAAEQTQQEEPAQQCVRVDASGAAHSAADSTVPEISVATAAAAIEAPEVCHDTSGPAAQGASHAAECQQGQKGRSRAKRPPKPKQPAKKKQNRKRGRLSSGQDENVDVNKVSASEHVHVCNTDTAAPDEQKSNIHDAQVVLGCPASSSVQAVCQKVVETEAGNGPAGKHDGKTKPTR